jgi:uncharacterized protein (DUF952 family)
MCPNASAQPTVLLHLCGEDDWRRAQDRGELLPESFGDVGFVHLSTREQVHLPANRLYSGRTNLLLLRVDLARLIDPLRWEPGVSTDPDGMLFPHLYGPLPTAAVIDVTPYRPGPDGVFSPLM